MSSLDAAQEIVAKLLAAGVEATCDPRGATPPCVLLTPPRLTFDVGCGATATWMAWCLAPGPANLDAWQALDDLLGQLRGALPVPCELSDFVNYVIGTDSPPVPAYRVQFTTGVATT